MAKIFDLHISLQDIDPEIWRLVRVPADMTLLDLHRVVQAAMGWEDDHAHAFYLKSRSQVDEAREATLILSDVLFRRGSKVTYRYDLGDRWDHTIRLESTHQGDAASLPECLAGACACPPEDIGGAATYMDILATRREALAQGASQDEDEDDVTCLLAEVGDPEAFSLDEANARLQRRGMVTHDEQDLEPVGLVFESDLLPDERDGSDDNAADDERPSEQQPTPIGAP